MRRRWGVGGFMEKINILFCFVHTLSRVGGMGVVNRAKAMKVIRDHKHLWQLLSTALARRCFAST